MTIAAVLGLFFLSTISAQQQQWVFQNNQWVLKSSPAATVASAPTQSTSNGQWVNGQWVPSTSTQSSASTQSASTQSSGGQWVNGYWVPYSTGGGTSGGTTPPSQSITCYPVGQSSNTTNVLEVDCNTAGYIPLSGSVSCSPDGFVTTVDPALLDKAVYSSSGIAVGWIGICPPGDDIIVEVFCCPFTAAPFQIATNYTMYPPYTGFGLPVSKSSNGRVTSRALTEWNR